MEVIQENQELPKSRISQLAENAKVNATSPGFMEPGSKVKGKRGRPAKTEEQKAESKAKEKPKEIPTKELVKPLVTMLSTLAVAYVEDERAAMKPAEIEAGSEAIGMILDKYMPDICNDYGPFIMAGMVFGPWGMKVYAFKKLKAFESSETEMKDVKNNTPFEKQTETPEPLVP